MNPKENVGNLTTTDNMRLILYQLAKKFQVPNPAKKFYFNLVHLAQFSSV